MKRIFFVIAILVSLHFVTQASPVRACSGYPYFGVSNLPEADLLMKATVIDADDSGHNAILRIEEYYKGEGTRFITVMRYPPALQTGAYVRGYDTGCLYAGQGQHYWDKGDQGYFGLKPNNDGTYTDYIHGTAHFYPANGNIYYQEGATEGYRVEFDAQNKIVEKDFIQKMLEAGNRTAALPPKESKTNFYPLMRFVNITTKSGARYQINPDRSVKKMENNGLLAISPDGAHLAFRLDDKTIAFQYIWTKFDPEKKESGEYSERIKKLMVEGQAVSFSNDNNLVAVWNPAKLTIYMITNEGGYDMKLQEVAVHKFAKGKTEILPKVIWSANGTTLAWQEASAIWHWNIFEKPKPQSLQSGSKLPDLMDISKTGRYVRVGNWNSWRLIDVQTRKEYPNTITSPNELFLITINRRLEENAEYISTVKGNCKPPLRENCQKELQLGSTELKSIFSYEMELLGIVSCNPENKVCLLQTASWHPAIGRGHYIGGRFRYDPIKDFRDIRYDVQYGKPVVLVGDYHIYFGLYDDYFLGEEQYRPYLDILDLENEVDSPIVSIEWGLPVFYDIYRLGSIEYHP